MRTILHGFFGMLLQSDRARFESKGTNCNLCAEACTSELGQGNTLFHLIDPEPRG